LSSREPGTREKIVAAAERVMRTLGLARATTKEIARAAGYSEATLYKHFRDKDELFLSVLRERLPPFVATVEGLPDRAGQGTVQATLTELARGAITFYAHSIPMAGSLFAEPTLLASHREGLRRSGGGPQWGNVLLAAYLRGEQRLGRISPELSPEAGAALLLGACHQRAFLRAFLGEDVIEPSDEQFVDDLVTALLGGLDPGLRSG
jgi:AcrR family transcriptional regulator